jgi:hypothetical protein
MKPSQALEEIGKIYVPGVAKYYAGLNPDPWLEAHQDYERALADRDRWDFAASRFLARCRELIERFKREAKPSKGVSPADALYLGNKTRVTVWQSRKAKVCVMCESKENLTLQPSKSDPLDVLIVCKGCVERYAE